MIESLKMSVVPRNKQAKSTFVPKACSEGLEGPGINTVDGGARFHASLITNEPPAIMV